MRTPAASKPCCSASSINCAHSSGASRASTVNTRSLWRMVFLTASKRGEHDDSQREPDAPHPNPSPASGRGPGNCTPLRQSRMPARTADNTVPSRTSRTAVATSPSSARS
ncbi:hypothetical protein [Lysobacter gummosus]|uniref:hypothetical protein n=1 Tax=Lysobacter gummosus TaxID=262324 RepID=UPI003633C52A